ncbi:MAG: Fic family protein [Kofleriaceae bacterium]
MPPPNEKLAAALEQLRGLQQDGSRVFASKQLSRTSRERLVKHGFLQAVMRGWLMSTSPTAMPGDTTPWFASFWEFCRRYCEALFGTEWNLSPDQSLLLHAENTTIPKQVIIHSPRAGNNRIDLLFGTSFFALKAKGMPPAPDLEIKNGLRVYGVAAALTRVPEDFFARNPIETQVVATTVRQPSQLLVRLLEGGHATIAGRLAGLFRRLGQPAIADEIVATMKAADHDVREADPLDADCVTSPPAPATPPIVARLHLLWAAARETVLAELPKAKGLPEDHDAYLQTIDDAYKTDAYHSLSIEGYQVTPELIERVAAAAWDPEQVPSDRDNHNALAARGYWLAFQRVREAVRRILLSETGRQVVRTAHRDWYRAMFGAHVAAGVHSASMLAGYRTTPVYLRGSWHVPPRWELLADAMPALFDLIENEPEPAVRAVLGHWLFGYVHPFPDGNGRIARFLMNTLFAEGGYPWTVIRVDDRAAYLRTLETASAQGDVRPFAKFVASQMRRTHD